MPTYITKSLKEYTLEELLQITDIDVLRSIVQKYHTRLQSLSGLPQQQQPESESESESGLKLLAPIERALDKDLKSELIQDITKNVINRGVPEERLSEFGQYIGSHPDYVIIVHTTFDAALYYKQEAVRYERIIEGLKTELDSNKA